MNYYQHHIGDYRRDTAHLSLLEHGIYRQLLDMYYLSETKIPAETEVVCRRLCARTDSERTAVNLILSEFFKWDAGWIHTRCDNEITGYHGKADRARLNGKLGGRPLITKVVISGNPNETEDKANHKPLTINQEPLTKNQEPTKSKTSAPEKSPAFVLPSWVDSEKWALWLKTRKKKMIAEQMQAQVAKLDKWRLAGLDYAQSLADAADAGWQGLQEPKTKTGNNGAQFLTAQQQRDENNRRSTAEFLADDTPFFGKAPESIEGKFTNA